MGKLLVIELLVIGKPVHLPKLQNHSGHLMLSCLDYVFGVHSPCLPFAADLGRRTEAGKPNGKRETEAILLESVCGNDNRILDTDTTNAAQCVFQLITEELAICACA